MSFFFTPMGFLDEFNLLGDVYAQTGACGGGGGTSSCASSTSTSTSSTGRGTNVGSGGGDCV